MRIQNRKKLWNLLLSFLLAATLCFIWGNSMLSRSESTELSMGLVESLTPLFEALHLPPPEEHVIRKLAHFGEFALLGAELGALFFINRGRCFKNAFYSALSALAAASIDEMIQLFSNRAAMIRDVLLDFSGALTAIVLLWLLTQDKKSESGLS